MTWNRLLAMCLLLLACDDSTSSSSSGTPDFAGEWVGQYVGSNVDLLITLATPQAVAGRIAFSGNLTTGGCGSTTPADSIRQGSYYADSLVFGIPTAAGTQPSTIRGRVRFSAHILQLKIYTDPDISMTRC